MGSVCIPFWKSVYMCAVAYHSSAEVTGKHVYIVETPANNSVVQCHSAIYGANAMEKAHLHGICTWMCQLYSTLPCSTPAWDMHNHKSGNCQEMFTSTVLRLLTTMASGLNISV